MGDKEMLVLPYIWAASLETNAIKEKTQPSIKVKTISYWDPV